MPRKLPEHSRWLWRGVGVILVLVFFSAPIPTLSIGEQADEDKLLIPLLFHKDFSMTYMHSVNKTPVRENFVLTDEQVFRLTSAEYYSLGVGTPFLEGEGVLTNQDGIFVLSEINRDFRQIDIAYMPLTDQSIEYGGREFDLSSHFPAGTMVVIRLEHYTAAQLLWQKITGKQEVGLAFE